MARKSEVVGRMDDDLAAGLTAAIAELEKAAVERAQAVIARETKAMQDRIQKLEALVERLQRQPQTPAKAAAASSVAPVVAAGPSIKAPVVAARPSGPVRRAAKTSRPKELPPLPSQRTLATLGVYLKSLGFDLDVRRASGGGAWVFNTQEEFGHVAEHLRKNGIGVSRYPHGRRLYGADHFEIDPYKVLPVK